MKKGVNYWSFPAGTSNAQILRSAARHGFAGAELGMGADGDLNAASTPTELAALRDLAGDLGIDIVSVVSMAAMVDNLVADDRSLRARGLVATQRQIELAHELGAGAVLVVPGYVGVDFIANAKPVAYEAAYDRALAAVAELAATATAAGVVIGIENVWNRFLTSPLEMRGFLDAVGSPAVGAYFDIGNTLATGYPQDWVRALGSRIVRVHAKDYRMVPGGLSGFVDLLSGDVDFPAVTAALAEVGYDGWISAEVTPYRDFPDQAIANASASLDRILAGASEGGAL